MTADMLNELMQTVLGWQTIFAGEIYVDKYGFTVTIHNAKPFALKDKALARLDIEDGDDRLFEVKPE